MSERQQVIAVDFSQHWMTMLWFIEWRFCIDKIISILTFFTRRSTVSEKRRTFFSTIVFKRKSSTETHSFWWILSLISRRIEVNSEKRESYRNRFWSSQILFASWSDAKSSKNAFSEACIEFCWINKTASYRVLFLFSIDFDVMFISSSM